MWISLANDFASMHSPSLLRYYRQHFHFTRHWTNTKQQSTLCRTRPHTLITTKSLYTLSNCVKLEVQVYLWIQAIHSCYILFLSIFIFRCEKFNDNKFVWLSTWLVVVFNSIGQCTTLFTSNLFFPFNLIFIFRIAYSYIRSRSNCYLYPLMSRNICETF